MNVPLIIVLISSVVTLVGIGMGFYQHTWLRSALVTSGEVIEIVEHRSSDGITYSPRVRFTDHAGQVVEFTSSIGSNPSGFDIGQSVRVAYSEDRSKKSILTFGQCYGASVGVTAFGIAGLLAGLVLMAGPKIIETLYLSK